MSKKPMSMKTAMFCAALTIGAITAASTSSARTIVDIDIAPPAPRHEVVPEPRRGYEWAPGYWNWSGREHVWVGGHWVKEHPGHHWVAEHWEQRGPHWHFEPGHWD